MTLSRSFKTALSISMLIHAGVFFVLDREPVAEKIFASPEPLLAKKPKPKAVRFELIDTPASAEAPEPPEKSKLLSDKNTRAQDKFQDSEKLEDSPHLEGTRADSKDTRPETVIARPAAPPKPSEPETKPPTAKPREKEAPPADKDAPEPKTEPEKPPEEREEHALQESTPEKEPAKSEAEIRIAPVPKEEKIIRLAKKTPEEPARIPGVPMRPAPEAVSTPQLSTSVDASNIGGDALIEGEISFGATRHFFGEYLLKMKQSIETEWISQLISQYTGIAMSKAVIDFKIQPDGRATNIVAHSNEGDPYFPLICISSIRDAQPFEKIPYDDIRGLPAEFRDKPLNIRFTFRYN